MGASPQLQDEEDKRFKRELIAGGVICLFFGIVGFIVQGPDGAANFAWAAFTASAVFLISVDHECSVFASTVIVCCIFGAIGLFVGGINGAFYGAGLAFSNSLLLFSILFVLEQVRSQSSSRKSKALARLPTSPRTQVKPDSTDSGEHRTTTTSVHDPKSLDDRVRLPTPTELDGGTFTRLLAEDLEQMVAEKRAKEAMQKKYPTARALVMARMMKRVAAK
jgi:hypothetical protein